MYVCMYVCMYACLYVGVYVCIYLFIYLSTYLYVCMYVCMHVSTCMHVYVYAGNKHIVCVHICIHTNKDMAPSSVQETEWPMMGLMGLITMWEMMASQRRSGSLVSDNQTREVCLSLGEASQAEEEGFAGWAPLQMLHGILQA